jgi:DNA mismatch endonuclease, patch repair protein
MTKTKTQIVQPRDPAVASRTMNTVRAKDTKPEVLRRAVHARGGRYGLHAADMPGSLDPVVRGKRIAIFVDGELSHGNSAKWRCRGRDDLACLFPTRTQSWVDKLERNVRRDQDVDRELAARGWRVLRLWVSDITNPDAAADRLIIALREDL